MKKLIIVTIALISILLLSVCSYAQPAAGRGAGAMGGGRGAGGMGGMGAARGGAGAGRGMTGMFGARRGGFNTESISAAVTAIEEQIAAIKAVLAEAAEQTDVAGAASGARGAAGGARDAAGGARGAAGGARGAAGGARGAAGGARGARGAGGMDLQAMQERTAKVQEAAGAIANQCLVLDNTPLQTEVTELQAALTQANTEEAEETAALIQAMITARQEKAQELGIRIRGARGGARGGFGGMGGRGGGSNLDADLEFIHPTESPGMGQPMASLQPDADGFISMFNGKDLTGWDGLENYWSVQDGAIDVVETPEQNTQACLVWMDSIENPEKYDNFELHVSFRWLSHSGNSGVQFRSIMDNERTKHLSGYQPDMDGSNSFTGALYDERNANGRHSAGVGGPHMGPRGYKITYPADGGAATAEPLEDSPQELAGIVKASGSGEWNDMIIFADGPRIVITINGHVCSEVIDEYPTARKDGVIGFQQHQGQPMKLQFKDIKIKFLD